MDFSYGKKGRQSKRESELVQSVREALSDIRAKEYAKLWGKPTPKTISELKDLLDKVNKYKAENNIKPKPAKQKEIKREIPKVKEQPTKPEPEPEEPQPKETEEQQTMKEPDISDAEIIEEIEGGDDQAPSQPYNPLAEKPIERPYTKPNIDLSQIPDEIPEPEEKPFTPPADVFGDEEPEPDTGSGGGKKSEPSDPVDPFVDPQMDNKDQKQAAINAVDATLAGYEKLHQLGRFFVEVPEEKLAKMAMEGRIPLDLTVDMGGHRVTVGEFVNQFNEQAKDILSMSDDFRESVRPVMIRVYMKRGIKMSDETFLLYKFAEDLGTKTMAVWGLKNTINGFLRSIEDMYKAQKQELSDMEKGEKKTEEKKEGE